MDLEVTDTLVIPAAELEWGAVRASGPGGQNVNKVATKVELRFDVAGSTVLSPAVKARLVALAGRRIDAEGRLLIISQASRSQSGNLADARERLAALVRAALVRPKTRRRTRPTRGSVRRRLDSKRRHAEKKADRRRQDD